MMNAITVRCMREADLPAADELRRVAGWNQTLADWRRLLELAPSGCFVACLGQNVVGCVTTTVYGATLAWVGMMLVHPDHRGKGIGKLLMQHSIRHAQEAGVGCIRLDATPLGRPLYEKLGFLPEWEVTRYRRDPGPVDTPSLIPPHYVRQAVEGDWPAIDRIDAQGFGASRSHLLRRLVRDGAALLVVTDRSVSGWGMFRSGAGADYLGPMICQDSEGARALAAALLSRSHGRSLIWDIPDPNLAAVALAKGLNAVPVRPLTRMRLGPDLSPSNVAMQFALADPALG